MNVTGRAAVYSGLGKPLEIKEYPLPEPEPGAILVKVSLANICGSDLHMWRGDVDLGTLGAQLPTILGHEMTGTVARLGSGVFTDSTGQALAVGDRVVYSYYYSCGRCPACLKGNHAACPMNAFFMFPSEEAPHFVGGFAEYYYLRPNHTVFKVPDDLTDAMVASVNCALSEVIYGFEKVGLQFGETVVVQGAGGLGINACAVAKDMGAHRVIAIDGIPQRLELAKLFGADEIIDINEFKTPQDRIQRVRELTAGWGADVVAELVGTPKAIEEGLEMACNGGRYLEIGNISPFHGTFQADPALLVMTSKSIFCVVMYGRDTIRKALDFLSRTKDKYPFDKILSCTYSLDQINEAFREQDQGSVCRASIVM